MDTKVKSNATGEVAASKAAATRNWTIHNPADLGRAIAGVRAERGLTQSGLASQVEIDRGYLARLEAGADQLVLERSLRALRRMGATVSVTIPASDGRG
jgi:DNA-binding XRE family transcriptional regulator